MSMRIEISYGEVLDKITILEIKAARINEQHKQDNVLRELASLNETWGSSDIPAHRVDDERRDLKRVNESLWEIEDRIRLKEAAAAFDEEFMRLARSVYLVNDERSRIKRRINDILGSAIVEEKSYQDYRR